jgi:hypothetical protein
MPVLLPSKVFSRNGMMDGRFVAHTEVLEEIEKLVEKNLIQSIQITEKNCIVTVFDPDTKHILLTRGNRN